jgi:membrane protease YdiL (CAAX protease family)
MTRYSRRQLLLAKAILVGLAAVLLGPQLADPGERAVTIMVVLAILGLAVTSYEILSHALALLLGRLSGSGTSPELSASEPATMALSEPVRRPLRLRHVIVTFLAYLGAQAIVWTSAAIVVALRLGNGAGEEAISRGLKPLLPALLPVSVLAGGLGVVWGLRSWVHRFDPRGLVETVAIRAGTRSQLRRGIVLGATLGLVALLVMPYVPYSPSSPDLVDELIASSTLARWSWIVSAVILAPPVEELVFRGVLLGGLTQVWSLRAAAVVSAITFWAMHAPEWLRYWPAAVAIGLMTIIVTVLRLRTRALGPCIAAHSAYNLLMASAIFGIQTDGGPGRETDGPRWARLAPGSLSRIDEARGRLSLALNPGTKGEQVRMIERRLDHWWAPS